MELVTITTQTVDPLQMPASQLQSLTSAQLASVYGDVNNTYSSLCQKLQQSTDPKAKTILATLQNTQIPYTVEYYQPATKLVTVPLKSFAVPQYASPSLETIPRESMASVMQVMNAAVNAAKAAALAAGIAV